MALQPEIRTDSLAGQLSDSLPTTETALRESIFRLRDSLATIPPDTLQATPPVTAEELFGAGSTLAIEPFPTQSVRPYTNRPLSKGSYWPWFSLIWSSSTITCGKFISSVGN